MGAPAIASEPDIPPAFMIEEISFKSIGKKIDSIVTCLVYEPQRFLFDGGIKGIEILIRIISDFKWLPVSSKHIPLNPVPNVAVLRGPFAAPWQHRQSRNF
jgi:hypothetical protein